ncbi:MAG: acetolactate synthase small subunit [Marinicaulis sp.]|nr:acetolactate synthase small subunit [Marinicaulis sp.]NNE41728.1 acetolactate synthase small subunit [Marinicaulis sp.]NNL89920.1 acetolactate synthase small subunit [Marinicaulis sp.]
MTNAASPSVYPVTKDEAPEQERILAVIVDNEPGVLSRVVGMISSRGYNIESLTVAEIDVEKHQSRITIVTRGTPMKIEQIKAQLGRLVPVRRVIDVSMEQDALTRELALVKISSTGEHRVEAMRLADIFRARALDTTHQSFVFEVTGARDKINAFIDLLKPLGLIEVSRTGVLSIRRGGESDLTL